MDNREVGTIVDIWATGGNDIYEVKGSEGQQYLIPAVKEVIKQIDLVRRVMYIDPMKGLLNDEAEYDKPNQEEGD